MLIRVLIRVNLCEKGMDPIADMLIRVKNAYAVGHKTVKIPFSALRLSLGKVLAREGFLESAEKKGRAPQRYIECKLRYVNKLAVLEGTRLLSTPGRRRYAAVADIRRSKHGYGRFILSTNQGLLTDQEARAKRVGGELLCEVW